MSKNNSMSPGETNYKAKSNLLWLKEMMPKVTFDDASNNLLSLQSGNMNAAKDMINQMVGSVPDNPMTNMFRSLFGGGEQAPADPQNPVFAPPPPPTNQPAPPPPPKQPTANNGWGAVSNDQDAIYWAKEQGAITDEEAEWLLRWQSEANDGNNWVDGSGGTKNWDYMNSGLTGRNKGIVDKFYKEVSGNWGDGQPQQAPPQQPQQPPRGPQINPNINNLSPEQRASLLNFSGAM